jgi:ankyrin repeat protein
MMAEKGFDELLKLILDERGYKGTYVNREVYTMIAKYNRRDLLNDILQDVDNVSKKQFIDLVCLATRFKQEQMVQQLLVPIYVNKLDNVSELDDCFIKAAEKGSLGIVRRLLAVSLSNARRINPATRDNIALLEALEEGHGDVIYFLLEQPQVVNGRGFQASKVLEGAALSGNIGLLKYALERFGLQGFWTDILRMAYRSNNADMVQYLLDLPNFMPKNRRQRLESEFLAESGNVEMAKVIFESKKFDIGGISEDVQIMIKNNHTELIDYLITEKIFNEQIMLKYTSWLEAENVELVTKLLDYVVKQKDIVDQNGQLAKYPMFY